MVLPTQLQHAIDQLIESKSLLSLSQARQELTDRYRTSIKSAQFMTTDAQRYSYIATRLPATYAAIEAVLQAVKERLPALSVQTALDLGTGPGTALWALDHCFSTLSTYTLIEQDASLIQLGKQLIELSEASQFKSVEWQQESFDQMATFPAHDVVLCSYSIGELKSSLIPGVLAHAWEAAQQLLIIIEPGTPVGFERIRLIRRQLIELGAYLVAPCPHHLACPMTGEDWCHFAARVERSSMHRRLKGASLGHEDEKFSYVVASKTPCPLPDSRILRHPEHHSGHINLKLCTAEGIQYPTISRKRGELYKLAKRKEWGDSFPFTS
jgi:ribosomal protein RSM22 (predicted rRNA methylase)